jgi:hypothetical protein
VGKKRYSCVPVFGSGQEALFLRAHKYQRGPRSRIAERNVGYIAKKQLVRLQDATKTDGFVQFYADFFGFRRGRMVARGAGARMAGPAQ